MATTDATGTSTGTYNYDPFGTKLSSTTPANISGGTSYGWVGQHEKSSESDLALSPIQMGARIYLPGIGRFASVDPVEGGTENNYVYPGDPVNEFDLDGRATWLAKTLSVAAAVSTAGSFIPGPIGMTFGAVGVVSNLAQGNWKSAGVAAFGMVPGGKAVAKIASYSKVGTKALTKVVSVQAKMPVIGVNSRLFGTHGKGILNKGPLRAGWSKDKKFVSWRLGKPGSHNHYLNIRTNIKGRGHR